MIIDFNSIKDTANEELFLLAKFLDPKIKEIEYGSYRVLRGHGVRGFLKPDLDYWVELFYQGGNYSSPSFSIVLREVIKMPAPI